MRGWEGERDGLEDCRGGILHCTVYFWVGAGIDISRRDCSRCRMRGSIVGFCGA